MLVDERLGHPGGLGDVVHGGGPVATVGEEAQGDVEELLAALSRRQPAGGGRGVLLCSSARSPSGARLPGRAGRPRWRPPGEARSGPPGDPARRPVRPRRRVRAPPGPPAARRGCPAGPPGRSGPRATSRLRASRAGSGSVQPPPHRPGVCGSNQSKPKAASSRATGYGADGQGTSVDRRLDRGVAEPLPARGQRHHVAGGVGVRHRVGPAAGCGPVVHRAPGRGQDGGQLVVEAVLGRTEQPVGGAQRLGQGHARRHVLAGEAPGSAGGPPNRRRATPRARRVVARRPGAGIDDRSGCRRSPRRCRGAASSSPARSLMVTWRHAGSSGGGGWWRQVGPLPGQVVVVQDRGPPAAGAGHHGQRLRVEGQRAEVLHDHQVGPGQGVTQLGRGRGDRRPRWPGRAAARRPVRRRPRCRRPSPAARAPTAHLAASTETPSRPPSRKETRAAVGTATAA